MARVWTNNAGLELNAANLNAMETDLAATLPKWRPNYAYTAGTFVLSPAGDIVAAVANFTSGATYDATKWAPTTAAAALASRVTSAEGGITSLSGRVTSAEGNITGLTGRVTTLESGSGGGGGGVVQQASTDAVRRPLIGARVGSGSGVSLPDSQYFDELHALENIMLADADVTNWYRAVGPNSASDFTATVKPELAAYPNRKILYVLEMDKSNSQFNREFDAKDGIYPYLRDTLLAIKNSGYMDRVVIAPFHEGNGGGGTPGSIGAYAWQMYDTTVGKLYTPSSSDFQTGTTYGSDIRLNTVAKYKTAFQNVVTLARSLGVTSKFVQWFLAANSSDSLLVDSIDRMDMGAGYVGDAYADIVGLSYYNRSGDPRPQYSNTWPEPGGNGLREFYAAFERMTKRPLWLCETGCALTNQYGNKGQWYSDLIRLAASNEMPRIEGVIMFMQDSRKYEGPGGAWSAGMDMKLESTAQKQLVGRAINEARRPAKVKRIPPLGRNLLPLSVANLTTTNGWVSTAGLTLAVGTQYAPDTDSDQFGMRITKPAWVTGEDKTSHNIYRRMAKAAIDYVPNDPYVLSFTARASYDGFKLEAGIRQDGGAAVTIGDEIVLSDVATDYVIPFSSISDDVTLTNWRIPNFNFGNNKNTSSAWFEIYNLRLTRGSEAQPNVERIQQPKVRAITTNSATSEIFWNCEVVNICTVTLDKNYTLRAPTGTPVDGQELSLRVKQDGTGGRTLNLHSDFYSGSVSPTLASGANAKTLLKFQYDGDGGRWGLIASGVWNLT